MVSHLLFYQLALIALVWLFFLLLYAWPSDRTRRPHPAAPIAPHRPRSKDPTPFAGLTQKPHCALCEQDLPHPQAPPCRATRPRCRRRIDAPARSIPHSTSVPIRAVAIAAGSGWATSGPTAIPVAVPGDNATAPRARALFPSLMARSFMGSRWPWS